MPDTRLNPNAVAKHVTVVCECGWELWRKGGFTGKQAFETLKRHHYNECPAEPWARFRYEHGEGEFA